MDVEDEATWMCLCRVLKEGTAPPWPGTALELQLNESHMC